MGMGGGWVGDEWGMGGEGWVGDGWWGMGGLGGMGWWVEGLGSEDVSHFSFGRTSGSFDSALI